MCQWAQRVFAAGVAALTLAAALSCGGGTKGTEPTTPVTNGERFNAIRPTVFFGLQLVLANLGTQDIDGIDAQQTIQAVEQLAPARVSVHQSPQQVPTYNPTSGWWTFSHSGSYALRGYSVTYAITDSTRYKTADGTAQQQPTTATVTLETNADLAATYATLTASQGWESSQQILLSNLTSRDITASGVAHLDLSTEFRNDSGDVVNGVMSIDLSLTDWSLFNMDTYEPCPTAGTATLSVIEDYSAQAAGGTGLGQTRWDINVSLRNDGTADVTATGPGSFTAGGSEFICIATEPPPDTATPAERYAVLENLIQLGIELGIASLGTQHLADIDTTQSFGGLARLGIDELPADQEPIYDPTEGWWWYKVSGDYAGNGFTVGFGLLDSVQYRDTLLAFQQNPDAATSELETRRRADLLYTWPDTTLDFTWNSTTIMAGLTGDVVIADGRVDYGMTIATINDFGTPVSGTMNVGTVVREISLPNVAAAHPCPSAGTFTLSIDEDFSGQLANRNSQGETSWFVIVTFLESGEAEKLVLGPDEFTVTDTIAACGSF